MQLNVISKYSLLNVASEPLITVHNLISVVVMYACGTQVIRLGLGKKTDILSQQLATATKLGYCTAIAS